MKCIVCGKEIPPGTGYYSLFPELGGICCLECRDRSEDPLACIKYALSERGLLDVNGKPVDKNLERREEA